MKTPAKIAIGCGGMLALLFVILLVATIVDDSVSSSKSKRAAEASRRPPRAAAPTTGNEIYLTQALLQLRRGGTIDGLKGCAYRGAPNFVVDSVVDDWVIYEYDPGADEPNVQLAVEKRSGDYYGSGQRMNTNDYYEITGSEDFKTLMGQTKMVPVGRVAEPDLPHCQR